MENVSMIYHVFCLISQYFRKNFWKNICPYIFIDYHSDLQDKKFSKL